MDDLQKQGFFSQKREALASKIEKTPMDKFFLFFLVLITISAGVLGYLQFKKNLEAPLYSSYLEEKRGEAREKYLVNNNTNQSATYNSYLGQNINAVWDQLQNNTNSVSQPAGLNSAVTGNINAPLYGLGDFQDLTAVETKLLSGEITLQQLGIDDPELQKVFDALSSGQAANINSYLNT